MTNTQTPIGAGSESPPQACSPVHYVLCSCANCGWTDGFREDCISGQRVNGYCDNCDEPREFRVIEENNAVRREMPAAGKDA